MIRYGSPSFTTLLVTVLNIGMPLLGLILQGKIYNFPRLLPSISAMPWPLAILVIIVMMALMPDQVDASIDEGAVTLAVQPHKHHARADIGCAFHLLTGEPNPLPVGQLDSGQCRAGSMMTPSLFTWFGDAFVDQQGRGCWWTRKSGFSYYNITPTTPVMRT